MQPSPIQPVSMAPTAMSVRYSYVCEPASWRAPHPQSMPAGRGKAWHLTPQLQSSSTLSGQRVYQRKREDLWERELRIFGGSEDESESVGEDLKAPMLDVVLGLFDGLDYDDDACC